jgi:hypothetical protein
MPPRSSSRSKRRWTFIDSATIGLTDEIPPTRHPMKEDIVGECRSHCGFCSAVGIVYHRVRAWRTSV